MKKPTRILSLIYLALVVQLSAAHYDVYLLGGQSNGSGRADAAQLTPPLSVEQTDVRLYYLNDQDANSVLPEEQWINLAPGSGHGSTLYYATEFGPEVSFGRAMADAKPSENIAIIKYTYGGSSIGQWSATGTRYLTFVSTVQGALTALTTAGDTYELRGMLWQQGEADTGGSADSYEANLNNLISRVRTDLNGGVAFPFVIGSLSDSQYSNITTVGSGPYKVRQAQEAVAAADATVGITISDGFGMLSDGIHFDHTAQVALGQGHAAQMLALEGPDVTGPLLLSQEPVGASMAAVDTNLVATFNEPISLIPGGTVTLRDLGPGSDVVITIPDARVTVSGNDLVINPATDLVAENPYAIRMSVNSVEDISSNAFTGIGDDTTWAFSVGNASATSLVHHWALDGSAVDSGSTGGHDGTAQGDASYTTGSGGVFGEAVSLDGNGDSIFVNQSSLPATDFTLTAWVKPASISGFTYVAGTQQSGNLGAFLRVDDGGDSSGFAFVNLLSPADPKKAFGGTVPVGFWTHLAASVDSTNGLTLYVDGSPVASDPTGTEHSPYPNFRIGARPDNGANNGFDGLIDDVAVFDGVLDSTQLGNVIAHGAANFNVVVEDNDPPEILTLAPEDGGLTVAIDADLVITFNELVRKGSTGDIVIKENGGAILETIPVTDARVGISGAVVTINPSATFALNQGYHVQIADGAIEDSSGNAWTGIVDTDSTTWNFATIAAGTTAGTTGVFDENTDATNALDIEIPASTLEAFKTSVLAAYNSDLGGVIDWETGVTAVPSPGTSPGNTLTSVAATYGIGSGKVLVLTFDRQMALYTNDINNQVEVLSQQGSFHNSLVPDGGNAPAGLEYSLAFSGAEIIEVGMAIPSRNTSGALGVDFRATASHSGGGSEVVDFTAGGTPGTGDTFLHFTAPSSQSITSVSVAYLDDKGQSLANGQRRPILDDLGFVVAGATNNFAAYISNPAFGLDPGDQGFEDDPDGDRLPNGLEAWFGTNPGEFNGGLDELATDGTITTLTHSQNVTPPSDLTGFYEWSPNLGDWYAGDGFDGPDGGPTVAISPNTVGAITTVTATASEALDRVFLRAGVTLSP